MKPVTVLMAVYNEEARFLRSAIRSILCQTFADFEFLIVDDGSTDPNCLKVLEGYAQADPRIKILRNAENKGLTAALNQGLSEAKGTYIARIDSDDLARPERLAKQVDFLEKRPDYVLCGAWVYLINEDDEIIRKKALATSYQDIRKLILHYNIFTHSSLFFKREVILQEGGYTSSIKKAQDYDLILKLAAKYLLANIPEFLGFYRISPKSISEKSYKSQEWYAITARIRAFTHHYGYSIKESIHLILPIFSYLFLPTALKKQLIWLIAKKA